jgi:tetratricopeptide (TPR) repeat protein
VLDETTQKLLSNYAASYIQLAYSMREPLTALQTQVEALGKLPADKDTAGTKVGALLSQKKSDLDARLDLVISKLDQCVGLMPWDWRPRALRNEFLVGFKRAEEAERRMREALNVEPGNVEYLKMLSMALDAGNKKAEANKVLRQIMVLDKDPWRACATLARNFEEAGAFDSAVAVLKEFQDSHPGDRRAAGMISYYEGMKAKQAAPLVDTSKKAEAAQTGKKG